MYDIDKFRSSNYQISSVEMCDAADRVRRKLHDQWENEQDAEGRELCYHRVQALHYILIEMIRELGV
jgi:hypothetical protein